VIQIVFKQVKGLDTMGNLSWANAYIYGNVLCNA